ncbi:MAG: GntR family transcriptional regulator [Anaerolineae bacterium]
MKVPSLKRENLRDAVLRLIEEALLRGELAPGSHIVEAELARQAGISRGPVREAIQQLVGEGVLVHYPSRGTFVAHWTPQAVEEAYTLRAVLERLAVQEAVQRATPDDLAQLQAIVDEMAARARDGDARALVCLDVRFHEQLYALSGHSLLQEVLARLRRRLYALMGMDEGYMLHKDRMAQDHQRIVDALKTGDATLAGEVVSAHILAVGSEVMEQVRQRAGEADETGG